MGTISLRIKELIDLKKMNISSFEKLIGVGNNSIGTIINRNSNVSGIILSKILTTFEDVNIDYLLTGKGKILRSLETEEVPSDIVADKTEIIELQRSKIATLEEKLQQCQDEKKLLENNKLNV